MSNYIRLSDEGVVLRWAYCSTPMGDAWLRVPQAGADWIGGTYVDGVYTPATPDHGKRITKLAFDNRFTDTELVTIELASIDDPNLAKTDPLRQLAANLRVQQRKLMKATFVDLARGDTRAGVQQMEAYGLIGPGRAAVILDSPVQSHEVPQ